MKNEYHIAQFGTYDIESLGDTTFPKMLSFGLQKQINCRNDLFSLTESDSPYNYNSHVYSFEQFKNRHKEDPFDAVVIGGGEFIHFAEMSVIIDGIQTQYPKGYVWTRPIELALDCDIPVYVNCCGVSYDLTNEEIKKLYSLISKTEYISVRDVFSAKRLQTAGLQNVVTVADNLWYMNQMYPKQEMGEMRKQLEERFDRDYSTPYMIVQYGTTRDVKALAQALHSIKAAAGYRILLMAVNYCHEDRLGMQMLWDEGNGEFELLDDYLQPPEMIAVISGAKAFMGTSLHGNLTAASYGVPFIGIDMYSSFVSKMDGIFSMIGCEDYLVPKETGVKAAFDARMADEKIDKHIESTIHKMQLKLDAHFAKIAELLKGNSDGK